MAFQQWARNQIIVTLNFTLNVVDEKEMLKEVKNRLVNLLYESLASFSAIVCIHTTIYETFIIWIPTVIAESFAILKLVLFKWPFHHLDPSRNSLLHCLADQHIHLILW